MNTTTPINDLPSHITRSASISYEDKQWLHHGFSTQDQYGRDLLFKTCFERQRQNIFVLMGSDTYEEWLLKKYLEED